jgi:hypothetical protein
MLREDKNYELCISIAFLNLFCYQLIKNVKRLKLYKTLALPTQRNLDTSFTGAYSPGRTLASLSGFLDHTHTIRHTVGLLWTSDQPVAETATYTGQHNIEAQKTNIHAPSGIRTRDPSNQAAADLCLRSRGHWNRQSGHLA